MPATPLTGQISFTDVKNLTTDKLGYTPPINVSIGTLASVVRQFGQKAPSANNIAFSNFYNSTIAGFSVFTSPILYTKRSLVKNTHFTNLKEGKITVNLKPLTFKNNGSNQLYVNVKIIRQPVPGNIFFPSKPAETVYNVNSLLSISSDIVTVTYTTNYFNNKSTSTSIGPILNILQDKERDYTVSVTDLTTGSLIQTTSITINENGPETIWSWNS